MKILFLTSRLPFPPIGGDKLRTFHFIKHMKEELGATITLLSFIESEDELNGIDDYLPLVDDLKTICLTKTASYINSAAGLFSRLPLQVHYYASKRMQTLVTEELKSGYDVIFSHLIRMAQYLPANSSAKRIIDFTDAISLNYQRSKSYRKGWFSLVNRIEADRVMDYEKACLRLADVGIFISDVDADFLADDENREKIAILGNGVDMQRFDFYSGNYDANQICFVGNMRTFPNTDAVHFFYDDILPKLKERCPDIRFYVVGTEPGESIRAMHDDKNVYVTGFVDSVQPFIKQSACLVAPMRVGAGIQNKILEGLALGTPVVTTSIGAEGLDPQKLLVADSVDETVDAIHMLVTDRTRRDDMAQAGRVYMEQAFQWKAVLKRLKDLLSTKPQ